MSTRFIRKELKYLISFAQKEKFVALLQDEIVYDEYCPNGRAYHISNIYFDTDQYDVIRHSISKPKFKSKLRIRRYENHTQFLELKNKFRGTVYKKRVEITLEEQALFIAKLELPTRDDYQSISALKDMQVYLDRFAPQLKHIFLDYKRLAYVTTTIIPPTRLTFDHDLQVYDDTSQTWKLLLPPGMLLFEIKCSGALPLSIARALNQLEIYPTSFSKYGTYYKLIKTPKGDQTNV
ncbi:MAG TPA: polyphosphate polymerase domain-containing protein [Bacilli bacterium]|jgi:hypothetical protein|nr:polyphosphate polymerase domain-containing protein [Bacilli bacterium]MDD4344968.1 polyphosphate polymerase domain-containing protein [Bacilli bacterium]MDD4521145.1 polyphosphate polymerase domain-containing protein [Bacilli bacterium]MDY0399912.1 polyphosphate polymerase domain-containing protein [Bacilli bacterium]HKM11304.1 polyphosphate polymerase domain-containing protein [Bacilli bacterium]